MFFFGRKKRDHDRVFMLGFDGAGKKTAMFGFMQRAREVEHELPNFLTGQLLERFTFQNGYRFELMALDRCDGYRNPWGRCRAQKADYAVVVVDVSDQDRLAELVEALAGMKPFLVDQVKARDVWLLLSKQDLAPEAERKEYVERTKMALGGAIDKWGDRFTVRVIDTPGLDARDVGGMQRVLNEITASLQGKTVNSSPVAVEKDQGHEKPTAPDDELLKARITEANKTAATSDVFWSSMLDCTVESWDHYSHLRAGYFVVLESAAQGKGMVACSDAFMLLLNRLREADTTRFPKIPNRTMTTFWLVHLRLAAAGYQADHGLQQLPGRDDFGSVLLENPHLMDVTLWSQYYSKELLFSPKARDEWCLPDIKNLPPGRVAPQDAGEKPKT